MFFYEHVKHRYTRIHISSAKLLSGYNWHHTLGDGGKGWLTALGQRVQNTPSFAFQNDLIKATGPRRIGHVPSDGPRRVRTPFTRERGHPAMWHC